MSKVHHDLFRDMLAANRSVFVYINRNVPGIKLPSHIPDGESIALQFGYDLPIPIPDLQFDDDTVQASLSFGGQRFYVVVPWASVFAITNEDGIGTMFRSLKPNSVTIEEAPVSKPAHTETVVEGCGRVISMADFKARKARGATNTPKNAS